MSNIHDRSELIFILDRSSSMYPNAADVVAGFNSNLAENKMLPGECTVTTVLFSNDSTVLHDRLPIESVKPITDRDYQPCGTTALLDAIGFAMVKVSNAHRAMSADHRPKRVQFIIMTDGMENCSREFTRDMIRSRITEAREQLGWDFIFLGANIDAVTTAQAMGIGADSSADAIADHGGIKAQFEAVSCANRAMRMGDASLRSAWAAPLGTYRKHRNG